MHSKTHLRRQSRSPKKSFSPNRPTKKGRRSLGEEESFVYGTVNWETHTSAKGVNNDTRTYPYIAKVGVNSGERDLSATERLREGHCPERERVRGGGESWRNTSVMLKHLWYIRVDIILIYFVILYTNHIWFRRDPNERAAEEEEQTESKSSN